MVAVASVARRVLIVDDEPGLREVLQVAFRRSGFEVATAPGKKRGIQQLREAQVPFPLVVTDLVMPDGSGLEILQAAKERSAATEVIVVTAHSTVEAAIEAMRGGAYDFVVKPFSPLHLVEQANRALAHTAIVKENQHLRAKLERLEPGLDFGPSPAMARVREMIEKIAATKTTVLVTGESGTGKERIARFIHDHSDRKDKPFVVVNCGALPEALMESELFGHEKGSFTGAEAKTAGMFRDAEGGTIFLDEVGELPLNVQVKLLRTLQERKVRAVGSSAEIPVDVRVLAATNRDVEADVRAGKFRQDLYYRLNVIRLALPPLRERTGDISRLAEQFVLRFANELGKEVRSLSPDALRALDLHAFPGNIRELENMMERAVALAASPVVGLGDLPVEVSGMSALPSSLVAKLPDDGCDLDAVLGEMERRLILEALERSQGVRTAAAKLLGVNARSLRYRLQKLGMEAIDDLEGDSNEREMSPASSRK